MNEPISASLRTVKETVLDSNWNLKNVVIPDSKLYYIIEGEIAVETGGGTVIGREGDLMLIPARLTHSLHLTELGYAKKYWLHFELRRGQRDFFEDYKIPMRIAVKDRDTVTEIYKNLLSRRDKDTLLDSLADSADIIRLVEIYLTSCTPMPLSRETDVIDEAVEYIKKNVCEEISLSQLAKKAGFTPNYFIKRFKERTGYTPAKYISTLRIETAKFFFQHNQHSVSEVMEMVGIYDASYFSKLFKKAYGYPPKTFCEMIKNNDGNN